MKNLTYNKTLKKKEQCQTFEEFSVRDREDIFDFNP